MYCALLRAGNDVLLVRIMFDIFFFGASMLQDVVPKYPTTCSVEWVDAEDPLFLLYTSGSTGKPKVYKVP